MEPQAAGTVPVLICCGWNCDAQMLPLECFAARQLVEAKTWKELVRGSVMSGDGAARVQGCRTLADAVAVGAVPDLSTGFGRRPCQRHFARSTRPTATDGEAGSGSRLFVFFLSHARSGGAKLSRWPAGGRPLQQEGLARLSSITLTRCRSCALTIRQALEDTQLRPEVWSGPVKGHFSL